jgi:tRNA pseudouridine38-40 synthase
MQTIAMRIQYDGSAYHGWQRQSHMKSVQQTLEKTLSKVFNQTIEIDGSGRTDAGVHALGQCISFKVDLTMPIENVKFVVNRRLPNDIYVESVTIEPDDFHARYCSIGKTYAYKIYTDGARSPFLDKYAFHIEHVLDETAIRCAMAHFIGKHDFKTYMASGSSTDNTIRTIYRFDLDVSDNTFEFTITGDGFLYNMVRIIIGSLIHVGMGKISASDIPSILASGDRNRAKYTAPAHGLYLKSVYYSDDELQKIISKS